ncbi:MAG: hypothetical protein JWQ96_1901 [Segetibacter sp.]|jgi:acylphosphatase|nr:hypothetical protein [Segetibacter sp.]
MPTVHLLIKGKVQGVFYRATAQEVADELGVTGWVRNTEEGNVEAVVSGSQADIDRYINWCRQGPRRANVSDVVVTPYEETPFKEFSIKR